MSENIQILLSTFGQFSLVPKLLPYTDSNLNNHKLRVDKGLINLFISHGNTIAKNCYLRVENIPKRILKEKVIIIQRNYDGSEYLDIYETDGDVYMRDF